MAANSKVITMKTAAKTAQTIPDLAILAALDDHIAVIDSTGKIVLVNEAWNRFALENGGAPASTTIGVNYLNVCRQATTSLEVAKILAGIQDVLNGSLPRFHTEYRCDSPKERRWFAMTVNPLSGGAGAVIFHSDISELRKTRDEYGAVLDAANAILWRSEFPGFRTTYVSKHAHILGYPLDIWTQNPDFWKEHLHPDDRDWVLAFTAQETLQRRSHDFEYRMISASGRTVWLRNIVNVVVKDEHSAELVGVSVDITERKIAEDALRNLSGRLIEAQEEERRRIARELHDDINQKIGMLAVQLQQSEQHMSQSTVDLRLEIHKIYEQLCALGSEVQALSHRLHSSKLHYLGISAAARSFCQELSHQHNVEIDFSHSGIPDDLPEPLALCLFRVLQEALTNAIKYSGVQEFRVKLIGDSQQVRMVVQDQGAGFDPEQAMRKHGLGLISMRERLQLVNGQLLIGSKPGHGTKIEASVPLRAGSIQNG